MINNRIKLYFKSTRKINIPTLYYYLNLAAEEDVIDTFILIFNLRDCRHGKGERKLGRYALQWLFLNYPTYFMKVVKFIPEYGRWDDLIYLWPKVLDIEKPNSKYNFKKWSKYLRNNFSLKLSNEKQLIKLQKFQLDIVELMAIQLLEDKDKMEKKLKISHCCKWAPSENDSLDKKFNVVKILCKKMNITKKDYRKNFITPLRAYLRHFRNIKKISQTINKTLVNESIRIITDIVKNGKNKDLERQWKCLERDSKDTLNFLSVIDTSYSMQLRCKLLTISLGILSANSNRENFGNTLLTYPNFINFKDTDTCYEKYLKLINLGWQGKIDIEQTLRIILNKLLQSPKLQSPKYILIMTSRDLNIIPDLKIISTEYQKFNYKIPKIIYWNLYHDTQSIQIKQNIVLVKGFVSNLISDTPELDPYTIVKATIYNPRYQIIKNVLSQL
tara:strand:- start:124 stop:1455 length:1332 start_codon:yes stop_codon:yes gene_type:complete